MVKKSRTGGRPRGAVQRKAIVLPSGDSLTPLYTTFSEETGLTPKSLQRMRKRFQTRKIAGVTYVLRGAALQTLSEPKKQVRR
jgi:hypothetical protein